MTKAERFFSDIKNSRVAFIGTGVSHRELISVFLSKGINVVVCDKKDKESFDKKIYDEFALKGAEFSLGENYLDEIFNCDIVFRTPGMYYNNEILTRARKQGIVVTSEMEVFFDLCPCPIIAVTGSDGKTTSTTLISEMLKAEGKTVHLGGNIGKALLPIVENINETDVAVVELSSFQLISMRKSPDVAVITNISPNHLDVHGTMEEYIDSKCNLIRHQNAFSRTVLNFDNENTMKLADLVRGKLVNFSLTRQVETGSFLREDGMLCYREKGVTTEVVHKDNIRIPGIHNVDNYLTAIAAVWGKASVESIVRVAENFGGVEHRIEFVRELDGVRWYNDSIATSPTRVIAGLNSFDKKIIIIAGGYDKKIPFEPLAKPINERVKTLILMGATADKIEKAVTECEYYPASGLKIVHASSMEDAVKTAKELAQSGDIVSLSPACASFDMYPMFEVRGNHFKQLVNEL
ncbi:MAG: UDP-N-acetylmuramoyl-L-alanine--D-glutamate ligase [Ruminococcus sp.]|nr:UDP-N-acetylmuramoyl-L-alanine--D-glutamate ligase [Ruminococcus sp.]